LVKTSSEKLLTSSWPLQLEEPMGREYQTAQMLISVIKFRSTRSIFWPISAKLKKELSRFRCTKNGSYIR
jgi:hypothetical protein